MYVDKKPGKYFINLKTKELSTKLFLNFENKVDFLFYKKKAIDLSSFAFDILVLIKKQDKIFLGGISSILLKPYENVFYLKSSNKREYQIENLIFKEGYIMENINKYYDIKNPIRYKGKLFFRLKPVYAVLSALKENENVVNEKRLENFIKEHKIDRNQLLEELNNFIRNKELKEKIKKLIDILFTSDVFKIKLKYKNLDYKRFDIFNSLANILFSDWFYKKIKNDLKDYLSLRGARIFSSKYFFREAYFSNYIEGTEFSIDEAKDIIENKVLYKGKENDTHHLLNYYDFIKTYYSKVYGDFRFILSIFSKKENNYGLLYILKKIHQHLLKHTNIGGKLKTKQNAVGTYIFTLPDKVIDTLNASVEIIKYYLYEHKTPTKILPLILFLYFHSVITEIHPFADGNGRTTRIFTNLILLSGKYHPIIITDMMRKNYLGALQSLSNGNPYVFIEKMFQIMNYQKKLDYSKILNNQVMLKEIDSSQNFLDFFLE